MLPRLHGVESPTWSALGRVVAYAETGQSGVAEIAPSWSRLEEIRIHQFILSKGVYGDLRMEELKPVSYYVHASTSPLSN